MFAWLDCSDYLWIFDSTKIIFQVYYVIIACFAVYHFTLAATNIMSDFLQRYSSNIESYTDVWVDGINRHFSENYPFFFNNETLTHNSPNGSDVLITATTIFLYFLQLPQFLAFGDCTEFVQTMVVIISLQIIHGFNVHVRQANTKSWLLSIKTSRSFTKTDENSFAIQTQVKKAYAQA